MRREKNLPWQCRTCLWLKRYGGGNPLCVCLEKRFALWFADRHPCEKRLPGTGRERNVDGDAVW